MISAVDLLKGLAVGAQMDNVVVEGQWSFTNYEGKADAAVNALTKDLPDFALNPWGSA